MEEKLFGLTHFNSKISLLDSNSSGDIPNLNPKFNWEATETEWFVDQINKMMLGQNPSWKPDGENGKGDAIGRSFIAFFCYNDPRFLDGIEACWEKVERKGIKRLLFGKYYYQGHRYPVPFKGEIGLSRDHTIYTILAFKYAGYSDEFIKDFVTHLRYKISDFAMFTPEMWLWARAVANIKPYKGLYYFVSWIVTKLTAAWNRRLYKFTGFGPESHQDDFIKVQNSFKPKRVQKMTKWFYPIYALHLLAWQLKVIDGESKWKKRVQKAALELCPEHNYVIKLLLGYKNLVTQEQVDGYKSMVGGRWTGILNTWLNDRDVYIIEDPKRLEWNVQDVDYLNKLYYTIPCTPI